MGYWLFKSEPETYSIDDLKRDRRTEWDGIRNYQARNYLRDEVEKGDLVLFYHSNAKPPHVAGVAKVVRAAYPDPTQFEGRGPYFDAKATREEPRWYAVDVRFVERLPQPVPIAAIRADPHFADLLLVKNSRVSVQPVSKAHFARLLKLGGARTAAR